MSEATLIAHDAIDLKGKLTFFALSESVGIELSDGSHKSLFDINTPVPVECRQTLSTAEDNQTAIEITFLHGVTERAKDNHSIGTVEVNGIAPRPTGAVSVELTLLIDKNGNLHVSARDLETGEQYKLARVRR
ncbi:MAG: Hsp70 family protein [Pirellulales bacterium]|nr:Hsp70 family protein [Pirellulales bacterium]